MNKLALFLLMFISTNCTQGNIEDIEYRKFISDQSNNITKKYKLTPFGFGGFNENGIKGYSLTFQSDKNLNVDQARILIVSILEDILQNGNELFNKSNKPPLTYNHYDLTIGFVDKNTKTFFLEEQGLAIASFYNKKLYYSVNKNSELPLDRLLIEPYSEAYEKVTGKKFEETLPQSAKVD